MLQSLDLARLDELVSMGEDSGTPMVRELIDLFINDSPADSEPLEGGTQQRCAL